MGTRVVESPQELQWKGTAAEYLKSLLSTTAPRQEVAGMTPTEQYGQDYLADYARSGMPAGYSTSYDYLNKLLTQPTDITQLPEYKAILGSVGAETNDAVNQALRRTQMSGMGASTPQGRAVGREIATGGQRMLAQLSPLAQSERNRQQSAAQMLMQLIQLQEQIQQGRLGSISQYGSLPRDIQNQIYGTQYAQQMMPYTTQAQLAQALSGIDIETIFQKKPTETEKWMGFTGAIAPAAGKVGAAAIMASDRRVKENIEDLDDAVQKVKKISAKVYNYKTMDSEDRRVGVIAQDIERIMPEAVKTIGGVKHVDYGAVAALAAQAVKELAGQIDSLKRRKSA